jgi:hypothetical protein
LKHNHRQTGDIEFINLLNRLRDGACDDNDCVVMNGDWGDAVSENDAALTYFALVKYFEQDVEIMKKEFDDYIALNPHHANHYVQFRFKTLQAKMRYYWNPAILPSLFDHLYKQRDSNNQHSTHFRQEGNNFENSKLYKLLESHIGRLRNFNTDKKPFIISTENNDTYALSIAMANARTGIKFICPSIDVVIDSNKTWDKYMDKFALSETKFEKTLTISIGQLVLFTANDIDPNASNNELGEVLSVKYDTKGFVDEITIAPCLSNPDLIPHPLKVIRKKRQLTYHESANAVYTITREQFPLKAADGFTPHAAQGVSFTQPYIINNFRNSSQGYGALYVSASRAVSKNLIFFLFPVKKTDFIADPLALAFDKYHRDNANENDGLSIVDYTIQGNRIVKNTNNV